jgi:hypothetical protein
MSSSNMFTPELTALSVSFETPGDNVILTDSLSKIRSFSNANKKSESLVRVVAM